MVQRTSSGFGFYFGQKDEHPVQNNEFLKCHLKYGAWLRCISARHQISLVAQSRDRTVERLAATANFYQQIAMQTEDICAMLIALIVFNRNESLKIPDVLKKISFTADKKSDLEDVDKGLDQLALGKKTVRVNRRALFEHLATREPTELLHLFGLNWHRHPSIKTVPKYLSENWRVLPTHLRNLCNSISDEGSGHLANTFNKIKHGPQLDVIDLFARLEKHSGERSYVEQLKSNGNNAETLRILFDGANVGFNEEGDVNCLLLEDNPTELRRFFYESQVPMAIVAWQLVGYVYVQKFRETHVKVTDEVREIFDECKKVQSVSCQFRAR
jgi:hypothetical protein